MKRNRPNPFYALLLVASTLFVLTAVAYLVLPMALSQAAERGRDMDGSAGAVLLLDALDRNAPTALAVECAVMIASGLLAMTTDRWFGGRKA